MGISVSDVVTSTPSVWGAANAATAAVVYPLAAIAAVPLAALVSAQMWHAGQRYGDIAGRVRSANTEMTQVVNHHASADHWNEQGKNAFVANRVKPYQATLEQAAAMYDKINDRSKGVPSGTPGWG
jgi:hypothetical protein